MRISYYIAIGRLKAAERISTNLIISALDL